MKIILMHFLLLYRTESNRAPYLDTVTSMPNEHLNRCTLIRFFYIQFENPLICNIYLADFNVVCSILCKETEIINGI